MNTEENNSCEHFGANMKHVSQGKAAISSVRFIRYSINKSAKLFRIPVFYFSNGHSPWIREIEKITSRKYCKFGFYKLQQKCTNISKKIQKYYDTKWSNRIAEDNQGDEQAASNFLWVRFVPFRCGLYTVGFRWENPLKIMNQKNEERTWFKN